MKYFTKYLPVEGEIVVGSNTIETLTTGEKMLWYIHTLNDIDKENQVLVKLFLCSKDIKVGDKVYWQDPEKGLASQYNTIYAISDDMVEMSEMGASEIQAPHHEVCKPIGLISPQALWVKEGDEFEEEDMEILYRRKFDCECEKKDPSAYRANPDCLYLLDDHRGGDFCNRSIQTVEYIRIKCPTCKQFH